MTESRASQRVEQEDPLEGGGGWYWIAGVLLAAAAGLGYWASGQTLEQRSDTGSLPFAIFSAMLGTAALVFAVWHTWRFRKFGHSTLDAVRPLAGERWQGSIRTKRDLATTGDYTFLLTYEEEQYDVTFKRTRAVILWKGVCKVDGAAARSSKGIPFFFEPPGAELQRSSSGGTWWLKVTAPMRGLNYLTLFDVTRLLDEPPRGKPWWGQALEALTND